MRITSPFGRNSYMAGGSYGVCDECGMNFRMSELRLRWDKAMVCREDWEPRHPQEFVRGKSDRIKYPGPIRPEPIPEYRNSLQDESGDTITDENGYPITT